MSFQQERVPLDASSSYFLPSFQQERAYMYSWCEDPSDLDKGFVHFAVGVYIAIASLYFVVVFAADVLNRYFQRKSWYPNRFISLNAISLTALSIAIKIPTDLTTPMNTTREQLSKLTGSSLVCIVIANTMPSLGVMDGKYDIMSNVGALAIVVLTLIVDLWIQINTNIIFIFKGEQITVMVIMFLQLLFVLSTAVAVPTTKEFMERQFQEKHNQLSKVMFVDGENYLGKIKENLIKYWIMAHTSNPQFVVARSPTCVASDGLCLVTATLMIVTIMKTISKTFRCSQEQSMRYLSAKYGYYPTVLLVILFIQISAIILGIIGPASRCMWWSEVVFKNYCSFCTNWKESIKCIIKVEEYWVSSLAKWKEAPLLINSKQRCIRKIIRFFKWFILTLLVKMQTVAVILSKLIRAVSVVPMFLFHNILQLIFHRYFFLPVTISIVIYLMISEHLPILISFSPYFITFLTRSYLSSLKKKSQVERLLIMAEHQLSSTHHVLSLEGERSFIMEYSRENGRKDKKKTEEEKNAKLIRLIENHSTFRGGFKFVTDFRANTRSSSHPDLLRFSWALPLVTLSCIAVTLPGVDQRQAKLLLKGVNLGLKLVRLIEQSFNEKLLINMREAAEFVWLGIDLDNKWLDFDLRTFIHSEDKDAREVVEKLKGIAGKHVSEFKVRAEADAWNRPYEWPPMVLAADCMDTVCTTILHNYDQYGKSMTLFRWLRKTISDILGACLTNLPEVIHMECSKKSIEVREEGVSKATNLFLETENLLMFLYNPVVASNFPERKKNIEEWESRGVMATTKDLSLHSEPSSGTTPQLDYAVIEVDSTNVSIVGV